MDSGVARNGRFAKMWRQVGARQGDHGRRIETDRSRREMHFEHSRIGRIAGEYIGPHRVKAIHRTAGIYSQVLITETTQVLDRVEHAGLNDRQRHRVQ